MEAKKRRAASKMNPKHVSSIEPGIDPFWQHVDVCMGLDGLEGNGARVGQQGTVLDLVRSSASFSNPALSDSLWQ